MHMCLEIYVSAVLLGLASAGGIYCARTARARAAALGLDYPGTHGAPSLSEQPGGPYGSKPIAPISNGYANDPAESDRDVGHYARIHPRGGFPNNWFNRQDYVRVPQPIAFQSHPRDLGFRLADAFASQPIPYPRAAYAGNLGLDFEQVKNIAPSTLKEPMGQFHHSEAGIGGRYEPHAFAHRHVPVVDQSVPIRHDMAAGGISQSHSGVFQESLGPAGHGPVSGRGLAPVSSSFPQGSRVGARAWRLAAPGSSSMRAIQLPGNAAHSLRHYPSHRQSFQNSPAFGHLMKSHAHNSMSGQAVKIPNEARFMWPSA